jgi:uncharacterized protein (TIGR02466 family)
MEIYMDKLEELHYFTTPIYSIVKTEFLEPIRALSAKHLEHSKEHMKSDKPMTVMTGNFSLESEAADFAQYVSQTAWNILNAQGYDMEKLVTYFTEMWTQEHNFHSSMDTHVHGSGAQISAFYFLEVPENACKLIIHDPRPAKVIINLPERDNGKVSPASQMIVFTPQEGTLFLAPAWLPHQFTRNMNPDHPVRFVHMNLAVTLAPPQQEPEVEII